MDGHIITIMCMAASMVIMAITGTRIMGQNQRLRMRISALESTDAHVALAEAEERVRRAQAGGMDELPLPLADAEAVIVIIDRVPEDGPEWQISVTQPVIWMHPRLQRSWRYHHMQDRWVETTLTRRADGTDSDVNHVILASQGDVFASAIAIHNPGVRDAIQNIGTGEATSEETAEHIRNMHPEVCAAMDRIAGSSVWSDARAVVRGERAAPEPEPVQPGAPPRPADNPFAIQRRPLIVDDE